MEIDEAQDVEKAKFNKDFSPMRASTGVPVIAYGTTWTDDTLLEGFKRDVLEGRVKGRCFRVLPEVVAESNRAYGDFVDGEVRRMGRDHPLIKTQYFLEPLPQSGRMFKAQSLRMMASDHARSERRSGESQIVAGLDFAGADESAGELSSLMAPGLSSRDSVALTIGSVTWVRIAAGIVEPVGAYRPATNGRTCHPIACIRHSMRFCGNAGKWTGYIATARALGPPARRSCARLSTAPRQAR